MLPHYRRVPFASSHAEEIFFSEAALRLGERI